MTVVRLRRVDGERSLALRKDALDCDPHCFRVSSADDAELGVPACSQRLERDCVIAIERGGRLLGVGGFTRFQGEKVDHMGLIWGMYVAADVRGSGAADLILASPLEQASAVVRLVQLTSWPTMGAPSVSTNAMDSGCMASNRVRFAGGTIWPKRR